MRESKFYEFRQNNTGGSFHFDAKRGISHYVIIEADSCNDAQERAEAIGIYFDGCRDGRDCSCCGDRWYPPYSEDAASVPSLYGEPIETATVSLMRMRPEPEGFVHYKSGQVVPFSPTLKEYK